MKTIKLLAITTLALVACGDNKSLPDAHTNDGKTPDAVTFPTAPTLGDQIDRMGRPAVNTVLNHGFDPTQAGKDAKDAYNKMTGPAEWLTPANIAEFMKNLAMIDVLDTGVCGNGNCEIGETDAANSCPEDCATGETGGSCGDGLCTSGENNTTCAADCMANQTGTGIANGCRNQVLYNGNAGGGGLPADTSYSFLAGILADDELYLDTSKPNCAFYLAVEYGVVSSGQPGTNTTCGGRAPDYDVIDFSYSIMAMGIAGIDVATFTPKVQDGVSKHTDVTTTFPYLGDPNQP